MTAARKTAIVLAALGCLALLGIADWAATGNRLLLPDRRGTAEDAAGGRAGAPKRRGADPLAVARSRGFAPVPTGEVPLLGKILPPALAASGSALLLRDDRAAVLFWIQSPDVKSHLAALKRALRASFSERLRDLIDETQIEKGKPPRDILSFLDPAIRPDRVLFARVRDRLYEFHIAVGREKDVDGLLDALTE